MRPHPLVFMGLALAFASTGEQYPAKEAQDRLDLAAAAGGNQAALARLYDRYSRLVFALALRVTEDRSAAEEVTQDVFFQLWNRARAFDPSRGDLISWLVIITRNRAIDFLRSRYQRAADTWLPLDDAPFLASTPANVRPDAAGRVRQVLAALPEQQRKVIEMAYYQGFTQAEIAAQLNQPLGTVKSWTRSALKVLREALES